MRSDLGNPFVVKIVDIESCIKKELLEVKEFLFFYFGKSNSFFWLLTMSSGAI
jgi:hypothetical protein